MNQTNTPSLSPTSSPSLIPELTTTVALLANQTRFNETISGEIEKALDLVLLTLAPTTPPPTSINYTAATSFPAASQVATLSPTSLNATNATIQTNLAVDTLLNQGYIFSASPYEPSGWAEIFAVTLLSMAIFLLPSLVALGTTCLKQEDTASISVGSPNASPTTLPPPPPLPRLRKWCLSMANYAKVFQGFMLPQTWIARDCDRLGCEAASLLLVERELGRFLLFLAVVINAVLVPIYVSFPRQPLASDFTPYTFQNVPVQSLWWLIWIQVIMVYLITWLTHRFSAYLEQELGKIETRFFLTNAQAATQSFYLVTGKHGDMLTEPELLDKCIKEWFPQAKPVAVKLVLQTKLDEHMYEFKCLLTCEDALTAAPVGLQAQLAPNPKDILWDAFAHSRIVIYLRAWGVNLVLMVTLFLFTTPVTFISFWSTVSGDTATTTTTQQSEGMGYTYVQMVSHIRTYSPWFGDFIFGFLPQLLLVVCDAYLLMFLSLSAKQFEVFLTTSEREISLLKKSYWFLLFNTLILPSLALGSVGSFVGRLFENETSAFALLGKAFVTSSGAFTLTFVATQTWVGASLDIARLSERFYLCVMTRCVKRWQRKQPGSGEMSLELDFGGEYAISLVMFALCIMFATVVPPILLFGVVYFFVKQGTDDYLLRHVFAETGKLPKAYVGRSAIRYLPIALVLLQSSLFGFFSSEACMPKQTEAVAMGGIPCVNKDYSGVLVVRGTFAQLLAMLLCLVSTCVLALREWILATKRAVPLSPHRRHHSSANQQKRRAPSVADDDEETAKMIV
ncbi:hypothetical protein BASA81_001289 [Batrachochytrium salamandrivorans]|nr:hypothetical protein BASA81_001289 [Batrachochytrium salamandrivorans]